MKMSRSGILTSGRRPSRPDGMYYRQARKIRGGGGGRRRRGKSGMIVAVLLVLIAVVAYVWVF